MASILDQKNPVERIRFFWQMSRQYEHVFLVSHMRSYSSLLAHLIGEHPEVNGYVEQQAGYPTSMDLLALRLRTYELSDGNLSGKYLFDKILHNRLRIGDEVARRDDVHLILSMRDPIAAVQSTVAMARRNHRPGWKGQVPKVAGYYRERLQGMQKMAKARPNGDILFFNSEKVIEDTPAVLTAIQRFLKLEEPLKESYSAKPLTGVGGFGDPSDHIKTGHVVKERNDHSDVVIPSDIETELRTSYETAQRELRRICKHTI